jgi:hypothetical protein
MKIKLDKEKIDKLSPEDAIPLLLKLRQFLLGKKKPDSFTRLIFFINLMGVLLMTFWNLLSYMAILLSDFIKSNKGFSVNAIIRRNGRNLGFEGQDFLEAISLYYFLNIFVWLAVLFSLLLMYRKIKTYSLFYFSALGVHFTLMFWMIGLQYFIEDITWFDKMIYAVLIISTLIHSTVMKREPQVNH